ncbi:MAG: DedA family protein [Candidatus Thermoplasmatota archaeon]|jgi:membrane protein DedA with SNARE-associated domain|nr:DedA family protein [Candidatus Thermoplasmatota archaeon]MCL5791214.1 DedA family protein [Candidatus Thermoplasmatota archaeon]
MSSVISGLIAYVVNVIIYVIRVSNYPGIFFLMFLEGVLLPIPSEVVMAFAGYLSLTGQLPAFLGIPPVILALIAGSTGNAVGAAAAYAIGYYGGRPAILRFGKYVRLDQDTLAKTEKWFNKYGEVSVFFTRLVPVFRTFISIPAGLAEMNFKKFIILTFVGTVIWDSVLIYLGYILGSKWQNILGAFNDYSYIAIAAAFAVLIYVYYKLSRRSSTKNTTGN